MKEENAHIDHLITRVITGEATEEEMQELNRWCDESEVNRKYFGDIQFINQKAVASNTIIKVDVDKAWSNVHRQMKSKAVAKRKVPKIVRLNASAWLRIAAIVVLVSGIAFSLYHFYTSSVIESTQVIAFMSRDSVVNTILKDNSTVILNKQSKITYSAKYGKAERKVKLEGEAYFNVKHINEKPFIVEAEGTLIQDVGTLFNVKAVEADTLVEVFVKSGEVLFFTKNNKGISLTAGEMGVYNKKTKTFSKVTSSNVNAASYVSKVFVFQNARLSEVVQQLNSVYNTNIRLDNEELKDCTISVTFEDEDINMILRVISETLDLTITKDAKGYIISGESCRKK
ncbi:MAG TPA: FecR domain-containing protein [Tenuifilaceae bacterium]|nr:FecR domain-containing protein [Tenuifilaceae bacterium]